MRREYRKQATRKRRWLLLVCLLVVCAATAIFVVARHYSEQNDRSHESAQSARTVVSKKRTRQSRRTSGASSTGRAAAKQAVEKYPYAVALDRSLYFGRPASNAPNQIALTKTTAGGVVVATNAPLDGPGPQLNATVTNVATKRIRVAGANSNQVRSVKVNTKLSLAGSYTSDGSESDTFYLFYNRAGTISLATPNYAGNVEPRQMDVMIEYPQLTVKGYVQQYLTTQYFHLEAIKYNGIDVDTARVNGDIPISFPRENTFTGQFTDSSHATAQDMVHPELQLNYAVTDSAIVLTDNGQSWHGIPYSLSNGRIQISDWQTKQADGSVVTWRCTLSPLPPAN